MQVLRYAIQVIVCIHMQSQAIGLNAMPCLAMQNPFQLQWVPDTMLSQRRFVKFQSVNTLSVFVESNQGDAETTIIQKVALQGSMGQTMNVGDIKKAGEEEEKS